jgi:O-antigen/teichoic acid export membrane protein
MLQEYMRALADRWKKSPTVRNISKVYIGDLVSKLLSVGTTLILIRGMEKSDYASYIAFTSIASLSASLIGKGINNALVRFSAEHLSRTGKKPYTLYVLSLIMEVFVFLILFLCMILFPSQIAHLFLGQTEFANVIFIGAFLGLGRLLLAIGRDILQAEERFNQYIGTIWLHNGLTFIFVLVLWLSHSLNFRVVAWSLGGVQLFSGIVIVSYSIAGIMKANYQIRIKHEKYLVRNFLSASVWLIAYFFILSAFSKVDVIMLSKFASQEELANYGVAFRYYSMAMLMLGSVSAVLRPKFSHVEMQDEDRQANFLLEWLQKSAWIGVPVLLFIVFGKPLFVLINGVQYESSFDILRVLTVGFWLSLMLSPLVNILISRKRFQFLFLLAMGAFVVNIVATYIGVRMLGGIGAAIAVVLAHNVVLQVPILWRLRK